MKRIAVVIDASGSMDSLLDLYSLDHRLHILTLKSSGGCDPREIDKLLENYEEIYIFSDLIFTDPSWSMIINPRIHVIRV